METTKRKWIYPKIIKGKLYAIRSVLSYFFLCLLFASPFIKLNGEQLILFNVLERKFICFGVIFWPQDFHLFVLALLTFIVFVVLFTAIFGRVFCGWICPQTIFMEMVFRKIEVWIEGDALKQKKLDEEKPNFRRSFKKTLKHIVFLAISFFIANIFLSYIIGSQNLLKIISEPINQHFTGLVSICIFTLIFYLVFSRMRELVCTLACPYGRLQGVLLDNKSIIVGYDYQRGEPRGKRNREQENQQGDCIDCKLCVEVCPTGIDIRKGTQMECINCTACIDACDMVMHKINRPTRLIGFKSEDEIKNKEAFQISKRIYAYCAILLVLMGTLSYLLLTRAPVQVTLLRAAGTLYQIQDEQHTISNLYNAELINKSSQGVKFEIVCDYPQAKIQFIQKEDSIAYGNSVKVTFFVLLPEKSVKNYKTSLNFKLISKGKVLDTFKSTFIGPAND